MSRTFRVTCWAGALAMLSVVSVLAHLAPTKSLPEAEAVLTDTPDQVQVWFTQEPDPAVSRLTLEGPAGGIDIGETTVAKDKSLRADVSVQLVPGGYTLKWRTAGDDGHVRRGDIAFRVRPAD